MTKNKDQDEIKVEANTQRDKGTSTNLSDQPNIETKQEVKKVELTKDEIKLVNIYKEKIAEIEAKERSFQRAKLRNNIILTATAIACVGAAATLIVFPPVGLIGIGIIAGAAALGIGVNIGEYFHKKMCKKREKEIRKLENEKSGILEGLTKCGFKVEKGKDKNHLIIKKYDRREYKFIPVDSLIQNKQKKLKKVNSFLSYFRFYMPGLERRLDKNIDKKLVNAAATDVIKYGQELVHQDINSRKNELDKVISSIEAERARAEQLERARGGSPIGSTTNSAYRPNLRTDPSLSLSPLHHRASASSLSSQNKAEGSKTKPAKTQQFIININNGKKEEKQKRPKPYRVDASKLAETLVKGKRKTKKPNTQTHEVNFRN